MATPIIGRFGRGTKQGLRLRGFKELERKFATLPREIGATLLVETVALAGEIEKAIGEARTPHREGALRESWVTGLVFRGAFFAAQHTGPSAPHAHLVEYGHAQVYKNPVTGEKKVVGHVPAHPFVRPAEKQARDEVLQTSGAFLGTGIERLASRGVRQGA